MKKSNKGFTIVELVIVIAVIAILAGVLIPTFSGVVDKANRSAALQTAKSTLTNALTMSSTATLKAGTKIIVDGAYAFNYTGNQLETCDIPGYDAKAAKFNGKDELKNDTHFNTILISSKSLVASQNKTAEAPTDWATNYANYYEVKDGAYVSITADSAPTWDATKYSATNNTFAFKNVAEIIANVSDLDNAATQTVTLVGDTYYLNYTQDDPATADDDETDYDTVVYINVDFDKDVVVFTTFG